MKMQQHKCLLHHNIVPKCVKEPQNTVVTPCNKALFSILPTDKFPSEFKSKFFTTFPEHWQIENAPECQFLPLLC